MKIDLSSKIVVITGASRGIGRELAKAFAIEGATVVINYFNSDIDAKEIYEEVIKYSPSSILIQADISCVADVHFLYSSVVKKFGRVDVLINNAGICDDNPLSQMTPEQWTKVINTNLTGTFLCSKYFSELMIKQSEGKIINISSFKGQNGSANQVNYSVSKAGIIAMTKTLAMELSTHNIMVNAVCPGFIVTDLNKANYSKIIKAEQLSVLGISETLPNLISFILYVSSDRVTCITGQVFNIDSRIVF